MTAQNHADEQDVSKAIDVAKKTGSLGENEFMAMLALLVKKEARLAEKEAALEQSIQARDAQRRIESENYTIAKIENQKNCKHLKGGKTRTRGQQRDPNVYAHTFTDGTIVIKCHSCGARWFQGDTDEYLTRNGNKIPNWTGIGWRRATELAEDSSNKSSSSERFARNFPNSANLPRSEKGVQIPNLQI